MQTSLSWEAANLAPVSTTEASAGRPLPVAPAETARCSPSRIGACSRTSSASSQPRASSPELIAHLIDRKDFPTFGIAVWWAIVTLGTVGYGDVVPHTAWGRVLGGVVIVCGVTFISFLVAIVTSLFDRRGP